LPVFKKIFILSGKIGGPHCRAVVPDPMTIRVSAVILYRLICDREHEFDSWFRNSTTYDRQAAKGVLSCPVCGSMSVEKAMMAPRINRGRREEAAPPTPPQAPVPALASPGPDLRDMLTMLRSKIEAECDYVGPHFAEEARAIAEQAAEPRPIYGEATAEEAEALREDGIEFAQIPWLPRHDA